MCWLRQSTYCLLTSSWEHLEAHSLLPSPSSESHVILEVTLTLALTFTLTAESPSPSPSDGTDLIKKLNRLTCNFNGLAISYTGAESTAELQGSWPIIQKSLRGKDFAAHVRQLWSSFVGSKSLAQKRILLVDDKDLHVHLETKLLNKERAVTTRFRDGKELVVAVELLTRTGADWPWDAVVLDQTMEFLNGLPTLQRLPEEFKSQVPITMYSTEDSLQADYLSAGAVGYVEKRPGSHVAVIARLKELISMD